MEMYTLPKLVNRRSISSLPMMASRRRSRPYRHQPVILYLQNYPYEQFDRYALTKLSNLHLSHRSCRMILVGIYCTIATNTDILLDVISLPNASVSVSCPIFPSTTKRQRARDHLEHLDRKIVGGDETQVRETLGTMQSLLEPGMISQFSFKHMPLTDAKDGDIKPSNLLSPFALMVLNHTSVEYLFPQSSAPSSPESIASMQKPVKASTLQQPSTPEEPEIMIETEEVVEIDSENEDIIVVEQPYLRDIASPPSQLKVERLLSTSTIPQPDQEVDRKRKRVEDGDDNTHGNYQKAAVDADLQELKELIWEISTAEDNFSSDNAGSSTDRLLTSVHGADGEVVTLSSFAHSKLEQLISHVIKSKRFNVLEVEVLVKLQSLCLGSITAADGIDGRFSSDWNESEAENWLADITTLESAFRASRTVLRIMSGGREEKLLYPEETVQRIINLVCKVIDNCITRVVESRSTGDSADIFQIGSDHKKTIGHLLQSAGKVLKLLLVVLAEEELSERPINDVLFFAIRMLFVENSSSEKDSVLGVQKFETFRRMAMNITSTIYSRYEDQRDFILRDILDSLQKLPTTKVHGRQFKLADGGRLQLTSVLLLKLVSTSGSGGISVVKHRSRRVLPDADGTAQPRHSEIGESDVSDDEAGSDDEEDIPLIKVSSHTASSVERNSSVSKALFNAAWMTAQKIISYLVTRASSCSKTGEQPHRHLLDMFVEDLITVFNHPEWPASEVLLRVLVIKMIDLAETSSTVSAKNMALETLGIMGTAILETIALARQRSRALEIDDAPLSMKLSNQLESSISEGLGQWDLAGSDGPYHIVLEHLAADDSDVQGYHLTQWAKLIFWGINNTSQPPEPVKETHLAFAKKVCDALDDGIWDNSTKSFSVSPAQCKLAYQLILLNIGVCKAFVRILNVLVASVRSDQVTVRARGLKSVTLMIEKEPSMLDRMASQVNSLISRCVADSSSMVRDNALALLAKCMSYRSTLDGDMLRMILVYTHDAAPGIKKRAMKLLKDLFLREFPTISQFKDYKAIILEQLLQTVADIEESVVELGRQTLEEIWLAPFEKMSKNNDVSVQDRVTLQKHVNLLKDTMNRSDLTSGLARRFLRYSMSEKCKNAKTNKKINRSFVAAGFDIMLDEDPDAPERVAMLQTMAIFAQANPRLLTQQQLEHLFQPYVGTTIESADLIRFRKVVIILRWVLPTLSSVQENFLHQVQGVFLKNLQRLPKQILNEVAACLWTINGSIENLTLLANIELSVLQKLHQIEKVEFADNPGETNKAQRFMDLAGQFGHYCNFVPKFSDFKQKLGWLRSSTVPGMIIAAMQPFAAAKQPLALRTSSLENIGLICEAWPQHFNDHENVQTFQQILRKDHPDLQKIVLGCFRNFFASQDAQFGSEEEIEERQVLIDGKIGGSVIASERDAAAALIAQGFVKDILKISLSSQDDYALAATEVLASILRQGLVHPKDIGPALVALSTSTNARIAQIALQQHETLHVQHESMFEREYMRAITEAFTYQKTVVNDTRGFVLPTYRAKLHPTYQIVKTSKSKIQTKFLTNYLGKIDFDPTKLDVPATAIPPHLEFARFMLENLAYFEYGRLEDLMQVINGCEKIVSSTGAAISDSINREILGMIIDPTTGVPMDLSIESTDAPSGSQLIEVSDSRLRLLTTSAVILSLTWQTRTFLRRLYNIPSTQSNGQSGKQHTGRGRPPKDTGKIPPRNTTITGDRLIEGIDRTVNSLDSRASSIQICKTFSELMAIDSEVKVPSDDADDLNGDADAYTNDIEINGYARKETSAQYDREASIGTNDEGDNMSIPGSARKRRSSSTGGTTPSKKRRGRPPKKRSGEDSTISGANSSGFFESLMFE